MMQSEKKKTFSKEENQTTEEREKKHFSNIFKKLINICKKAQGWKQILNEIDLNNIKRREDLSSIPITRKSDFPAIQKKSPPYGGFNIIDKNDFPFSFASPGPIYEPANRGDFWNMSSSLFSAGLRKKQLVYNTFNYHLGPAGIMMGNAANNLGATVIAGGIGNTDLQLDTISELKPDFYIGTPSFLKILLEKAIERKVDIKSIKNGLVGAEPFPKDLRNLIKNYGVDVLQMYGTAEVGCIAFETKDDVGALNEGMIVEENIILEIVRPGTNFALKAGEVGEVVVTKLDSEYPMIRLATGDLSCLIEEPSPCGRTNLRIKGWMGRAEQSTKFRGLFITPRQLQNLKEKLDKVFKVRLVLTRENLSDHGTLICETENFDKGLEVYIAEKFKSYFKLRVDVKLTKKNSIKNDGIVIEDLRPIN